MKKKLWTLLISAGLALAVTSVSFAASWQKDDIGWWYQYDGGGYPKSTLTLIDGEEYLFNENGYMITGWNYYQWAYRYFDGSGKMMKGWVQDNGKWYYMDEDGKMKTSWLYLGNSTYYLKDDGSMAIGTFEVDGYWFSADAVTGKIQTNKRDASNKDLKYNDDGTVEYRNADGQWEYLGGKHEAAAKLKEDLKLKYFSHGYSSKTEFEKEAYAKLKGYIADIEIEEFILDVETDYDSEYEDSWYYNWYA